MTTATLAKSLVSVLDITLKGITSEFAADDYAEMTEGDLEEILCELAEEIEYRLGELRCNIL